MVKQKKIRLKDIAYALNLSVTCVSRSLRDCNDISEDTKKQVRAKALELGYHSKYNELKTKEKYVVALIIDSVKNPYFIKLGDVLLSKFSKEKWDFLVMIVDNFNKVDDTLIKKCIYRNTDVILSFNEFDEKSVDFARINGIPLIMLGRLPVDDYVDTIYTDDRLGGSLAFEELVKSNKKRLLYLDENKSEASLRRLEGFQKNMNKSNTEIFQVSNASEIDECVSFILDNKIDGIFAYNDLFASRLMYELKKRDKEYFKNVKVVGYDNDIEYLNLLYPNFNSISFDYEAIGDDVVQIIDTKLIKRDKNKRFVYKKEVFLKK